MKKRLIILFSVLLSLSALLFSASCTSKPEKLTFDELIKVMDEPTKAFADTLISVETADALEEYQIEPDLISSAVFLRSENTDECADELILIEVSGQGAVEDIKQLFARIQQEKYLKWESGDNAEFEKVKNYKTAAHDKYMLYVVSDTPDAVIDCFERISG